MDEYASISFMLVLVILKMEELVIFTFCDKSKNLTHMVPKPDELGGINLFP